MNNSRRSILLLSLTGCMLSSCVYVTQTVPDMPYEGTAGRTYPDTWRTTPPTGINYTPVAPQGPSIPEPTAAPNPNTPLDLTQPIGPAPVVSTPAPARPSIPAPAPVPQVKKPAIPVLQPVTSASKTPAPAPAASKPVDMSKITNTGPIPVATRVPGDPTRVYNPLNPSKTIRVVDKNGNPYPSGKELKVRGTNFHFYVP